MKIVYTESAKNELGRFHRDRQEQLESVIKSEKYVFGDDIVEITASDIREAEKRFFVKEDRTSRFQMTTLLLRAYLIIGISMVVFGVFYERIMDLLKGDPIQRILVLAGIMLSVASFIGSYYFRFRQDAREHHERRFRDYEEKLREKDE